MNEKLSVIIPFLDEQENLGNVVTDLNNFCQQHNKLDFEIIFVDDGSNDNSLEILKNYEHKSYQAKVISFSKNYGSHAALRAGILHSSGNYITFVYADLQDPLDLLSKLYEKMQKGYDIVWANRNTVKVKWSEKIFSKLYAKMMKRYALPDFPESGFDVVMFNQKVGDELNQNIEANSSIFLQILSLGFCQASISYDRKARKAGKSKWTLSKKTKLFVDSFAAFSYAPIRFVSIIGIMLAFLGFIWAMYIFLRALVIGDLSPGWPALICMLMIGFGVTNISLGILAEYLWRTLDASRKRKVFIIDRIIELNNK